MLKRKEIHSGKSPIAEASAKFTGPLLKVEDLEVVYSSNRRMVHAVNGISFTLNQGETLGLVGETGAGKTTTALSIMRLLPNRVGKITRGKIELCGVDLLALPEDKMKAVRGNDIAMIFQDPMTSLNPILTVGQQVAEPLMLHNTEGLTKEQIDARVDELFKLVGVPPARKNEYPHQFSGGMKQRVVISMALACMPRLLIADEPTTALDVTIQAQVLSMMMDLKEHINTGMLLITHDLGVVAQTCDRVAVIYAGEIMEYGSVQEIFRPGWHHPYTEGLFGSIPKLTEETDRLTPIDGLMPDPTDLPSGCKFHPRCKYCMQVCKEQAPLVWSQGDWSIRCHRLAGKNEG